MMPPSRRKKWSEIEERTLIDKYGEMVSDGTLAKMKTREKKYRPISLYVNSMHHTRDPISYPWQWGWKDVSTKVQNMRHQYSLVKQKIRKSESFGDSGGEEFDWVEGLTHWSNFLRYKEVFGDVAVAFSGNDSMVVGNNGGGFDESNHAMDGVRFGDLGQGEDGDFGAGMDGDGVMGLEFEYDGEEGEENFNGGNINGRMKEDGDNGYVYEDLEPMGSDTRKKRKVLKGLDKKAWGFLANQLGHLRELETRFEQREVERERERQQREHVRAENEEKRERQWELRERERQERDNSIEKLRRQRIREWESMEKESQERGRRRREEQMIYENELGETINRRRSEWKKKIDETLNQHRAEMGQIQTRILHEQQNLTGHLLGLVSQWTSGHSAAIPDHTGASNHYLSQMMHHVNGIVHGDNRVEGDNQDDQFIVDG